MIPRPSRRIFSPMAMRTAPPAASAFLPNLSPNRLPILIPAMDMAMVTIPITAAGTTMPSPSMAMDIPTARASMLVASARRAIVPTPMSPSTSPSSSDSASRIMLAPMRNSSAEAIQ
jgi:hypothetical protein